MKKKTFYLDQLRVNPVIFADNSDNEKKLTYDDYYLYFLEKNIEFMK